MTVGELRHKLDAYPDTTNIVIKSDDGDIYHILFVDYKSVEDIDENIFEAVVLNTD